MDLAGRQVACEGVVFAQFGVASRSSKHGIRGTESEGRRRGGSVARPWRISPSQLTLSSDVALALCVSMREQARQTKIMILFCNASVLQMMFP